MGQLLAAATFFVGLHLGVAGTGLRRVLVERLGERAYLGAFSVLSLLGLIFLARSYSAAFNQNNVMLWELGPATVHAAGPVILLAFLIGVPGILSPNPMAVGQAKLLETAPEPRGIQRVSRHPFLAGVSLWAAMHLIANGDGASVVLFASLLVVAAAGMVSIDRKRARAHGEAWEKYARATSRVPFWAIIAGRTRFRPGEIGWWRLVAALAAFGAMVSIHPWLFGAYPLPGMSD